MNRLLVKTAVLLLLLSACGPAPEPAVSAGGNTAEGINEQVLQGWNTWNNPSVLSHVHLPGGLNLQFVLRKKGQGPYWLKDAYVASPRYNFAEKIRPMEHAYDGSYTALDLEWEGARATVQSATDGEDLLLLYTPRGAQDDVHILVLETGILWNRSGRLGRQDSVIRAAMPGQQQTVRAIGRQTHMPLPIGQPYFSFDSDTEAAIYTGRERTLAEIKALIADQKAALADKAARYGDLREAYEAIRSVVGWNIFYDAFNDRGIASVSRIWNEAWGGYIIFDWDTYFIALLASIDDKELAYANVFAITHSITDGGFIPNVAATYQKSNDRSQPPVGSMVVKLIYDQYGEKWFLEEVYDELLAWNRWWAERRDNQGYLSWGSHPHPEGMSANTMKAAKWESGLDNSPMFDDARFNETTHMMELASVGLMSLYIADCKYLAAIADELDNPEAARELRVRAGKYSTKLGELWDEGLGLYRDKDLTTGQFTARKAPPHFYPLLAGVPTPEQAARMVNEHLLNPREFYGEYMLPSISRDDPAYADNSYWRGRIWAPMNFLVYMGLRNYALPEARALMAEKSKALLLQEWREERHVHENYNADTGEGDDMRNSDPFYAWGGLLGYVALLEAGYIEHPSTPE